MGECGECYVVTGQLPATSLDRKLFHQELVQPKQIVHDLAGYQNKALMTF
ncbi:MAG: hypothetical protein F6K58_09315 [Symploca sp. SIO2E9]|nr:hypothetical protein [Symploca sp. SIO2E9]